MMPPQPPSSQDRPIDYPYVADGSSLLVMFGMALATPIVLWALAEPVRILGIAAVVGAVALLVHGARRLHRADGAFHVPGNRFRRRDIGAPLDPAVSTRLGRTRS